MSKNLSVSTIKKEHSKEFSGQKRVILSNGDHVDIQSKFRKTSIQKFIIDYQDILDELKKRKVDTSVAKDILFVYYMLLIKYFTSASNIPTDLDNMILVCEKLSDLGLLEEIIDAMPKDEIEKMNQMIDKVSDNSNIIGTQIGELLIKSTLSGQQEGEEHSHVQ